MTDGSGARAPGGAARTPGPRRRQTRRRSRVGLALALSVLAPLLLLGVSAWRARDAAWAAAESEALRAADAAAEYVARVLDGLLLRGDMANELLRGIPDAEIRAREREFHETLQSIPLRTGDGGAIHLFVHDAQARSLVSGTLYPVPPPERDFLHRDFNTELRAPGAPPVHVSRTHLGEEVRRAFFAVSRRREGSGNGRQPGEYDGVIAVSVDVESIGLAMQRLAIGIGDAVALLRADGQVLVRVAAGRVTTPPPLPPDSPLVGRMQSGEPLHVSRGPSPVDGAWRVGAVRRVGTWPVYVAVARAREAVLAAWRRQVMPQAVLALAGSALLGVLALAVRRREAELVEANALLERRVMERTADLAGSAAEFRATFEESPVGMVQADPRSGRFLRVNGAYCALTGYGAAELLGGLTPLDLTHPEDREADAARFRKTARTGCRYRVEKRYLRKGGTPIWVEVSAGLIRDPASGLPLRTIATVQDITERKRAEERLLLLTREVDHRAKNALAVVQAVVRLAPRDDPAAFAQAVEGRIAALAGAQVVLSEASWRGADLRILAEGAVRAFRGEGAPGAGPPPVEIAGPPVFLAATAAQPVSLALHELATNAAKYGALSAAGGRVRLSWSLAPDGALALRWEESGGPELAGAPARRGFGSRVLEATMAEQLGGRVQRHWPRSGLVCEITLPARSVIEAARPAAPAPAETAPA